jgi:hypothetical protein
MTRCSIRTLVCKLFLLLLVFLFLLFVFLFIFIHPPRNKYRHQRPKAAPSSILFTKEF